MKQTLSLSWMLIAAATAAFGSSNARADLEGSADIQSTRLVAGSYRYLFPTILEARVNAVSLEFARRGDEDLQLFKEFDAPFSLGLGVVDVKSHDIESPGFVAERIRRALEVVPAERLIINPDCGCMHLPRDVAFNKLSAMVEGARLVRSELAA